MSRYILIAGGGTGGHVFPGIAVAKALEKLADVRIAFAGASRGLEARVVPPLGYELELLDVEPMTGGGLQRAVRGALVAAKATRQARSFVRRIAPAAVLSVGGYAAGPAALACVAQRIPLAVLEPNSVLGLTNRLLAPFCKRAYLAWSEMGRHFREDRARFYGVPLRPGFEPQAYTVGPSPKRLLILGGSQGARALNEVIPRAVASMPNLAIVHQAGKDRDDAVRARYAELGATNVEVVPFLEDVAARMAAADLIVARAGAVTVAEISALGRAALFVPFPDAADDHQAKNALSLAALGGAVCVRQELAEEARLTTEIGDLLADDPRRIAIANAARNHGKPFAVDDIARDLLALAGIGLRKVTPPSQTNGSSPHIRIPGFGNRGVS